MKISYIEHLLWINFTLSIAGVCLAWALKKLKKPFPKKRPTPLFREKAGNNDSRGKATPYRDQKASRPVPSETLQPPPGRPDFFQGNLLRERMEHKKKLIGQILLEEGFISKDVLGKALAYQKENGGTITQYLLHFGHIDEKQLAQCLCEQFKVPYLPINSYNISDEVIDLIPTDIAEKYWILPLEKSGDALTIAMIDPLDTDSIKELEEITGLKILPIVGIISEILSALQTYYKIMVKNKVIGGLPIFIKTSTYTGRERRRAVRYTASIDIRFPADTAYIASKTHNLSRTGFSFYSPQALALGEVITIQINLPKEVSPWPIAVISKIVRCLPADQDCFDLGAEILKIADEEIECIIKYARSLQK